MVFNYKGEDLETALIDGQYTFGVGNIVPVRNYGAFPAVVPAVNGGGVFTPATYGLPDMNPGTPLEVGLEGETYMDAAKAMYQIDLIERSIRMLKYVPNDIDIAAATNRKRDKIQNLAMSLYDKYAQVSHVNINQVVKNLNDDFNNFKVQYTEDHSGEE